MIRAFAIRTASVLGDGFFGRVPAVGSMPNCVGAIEPCWTGCTLIGPVDVGLFPGITDNSQLSSLFDHFVCPATGDATPTPAMADMRQDA